MKKNKTDCDLKTCPLCKLCLKEWLPAVAAGRKNFQVKKGERIFSEGTNITDIYFIYSGTVKVHKQWGSEKELILRFAKKGDIVGHRGLGIDNIYPASCTAVEPTTVCAIDLDLFQSSLKVNPDFIYQMLMFYTRELKESERNMRNLAHMPVKGRVAQSLLTLHDKFGEDTQGCIDITLSRQDLASYAGTTYETVFRIMNDFTEEKILRLEGKDIAIVNKEKLVGYTQEIAS
ncbi:MAG TPA: Crp/Fnr family transcriptional regulator [Ferruginibacter sp.]|jgi:CRP-like cAMP-binding protein|nr:Crp/Fnr family transcriptional regulator [Ferruginibacter sp.]